jgi:acyl-CoA synthetase (AMP-forming)/AMP-acid ligase II
VNVAAHLARVAGDRPGATAVVMARDGRQVTYRELDGDSDRLAAGMLASGLQPGDRVVVMVPPGPDLFALVFGLFKAGLVVVMADPGMGLRRLKGCVERAQPAAFVGVARAVAAQGLLGWARGSVRLTVVTGASWGLPATALDTVRARGAGGGRGMAPVGPEDEAAVLFTSGSTGPPKGAVYRHGHFTAQVEAIREMVGIKPGEVDLPTFPLFALFDPALGMTTVVPQMDFTRPARVDGAHIVNAINHFQATNMFGSPALLEAVARWGVPRGVRLPSLRRVITAGAPVRPRVLEAFSGLLEPGTPIHTPYGATECLPVSTASSLEVLADTRRDADQGRGTCVGRVAPRTRVDVIRVTDGPVEVWEDGLRVPDGTVGEITVQGPQVTAEYLLDAEATALHKVRSADGTLVHHRTGDLGYLDAAGRLWFCGRKSQRVVTPGGTHFTELVEGPFNAHPAVHRAALVGVRLAGRVEPVVCVELQPGHGPNVVTELLQVAGQREVTRAVTRVLVHPGFPVDPRHNAKITREEVARWAARRLS